MAPPLWSAPQGVGIEDVGEAHLPVGDGAVLFVGDGDLPQLLAAPALDGVAVAVSTPSRVARMKSVLLLTPTTLPRSPSQMLPAKLATDSTTAQ